MKAMIFAAGLGTRLKPMTNTIPKALVSVGGKPLLQHTIEKLKGAGFDEIIINLHHFPEQIIDFVEANNHFGIRIEYSDEREKLLNTGGAIKKASWFFDDNEPLLIHNVDILSNLDLEWIIDRHREQQTMATLVCSQRKTSRYLFFDESDRLKGWMNEKTGARKSPFSDFKPKKHQKLAFSGIHIIEPTIVELMKDWPGTFSIIDFYLEMCRDHTITSSVPPHFQMIDVGKPEAMIEAESFLI